MSKELLEQFKEPLSFGTDGFVRLVDVLGDDSSIVRSARVSYGDGTKSVREDTELVRYLLRHGHLSPFEQCNITLHVRLPIYIMRQLVRQRTFRLNEYSARYSMSIDSTDNTEPSLWRTQSTTNKQASGGFLGDEWPLLDPVELEKLVGPNYQRLLDDFADAQELGLTPGEYLSAREAEAHAFARWVYLERLALGVAREQARKVLPVSTYTEIYVNADLRNLLSFLNKRLDPTAQPEIQELAQHIATVVEAWCPAAWQAHEDYIRNAFTFSVAEARALSAWGESILSMPQAERAEKLIAIGLASKSERIDYVRKIKGIFGEPNGV